MDYEKLHKDTINRLQQMVGCGKITVETACGICADFVPESEDERIRKELKHYLEVRRCQTNDDEEYIGCNHFLAWLEKQGEHKQWVHVDPISEEDKLHLMFDGQKPADKVEPRFHEGDWVVYKNDICQIVKREEGCNKLVTVFGIEKELVNERNLSTARLWTINDAKDGDVLAYKDEISLYKHDIKNCAKQETTFGGFVYHCCYDGKRFIMDSLYSLTEQDKMDIHPATKEQRDLLFEKMYKAGYEWDAERKELCTLSKSEATSDSVTSPLVDAAKAFLQALSDTPYNNTPVVEAQIITKQLLTFLSDPKAYNPNAINEHKSAEWSEEDELQMQGIIASAKANK